MTTVARPTFDDYVTARSGALLRFAYVLCGDRHLAEDLVQEVLIKAHRRWTAIEADNPDAYLKQAIVRTHISWRRRRATTEIATDRFAETGGAERFDDSHADRDELWSMLATLPRAQRAVLVLRYFEDLDDARIAELTGVSPSTVRTHAARGLTALRQTMARHADEAPAGAGMLQAVQRGAARATARRRLATVGAIAALVVAMLLAVPLLFSPPAVSPIDPSPSVTPSDSASPPPEPNTSTDPLADATLRVPPWPSVGAGYGECTSGEVAFTNARFEEPNGLPMHLSSVPVTLGGAEAYLAHLFCYGPGEGGVEQIVAYRATPGHELLGVVLTVTDLGDGAAAVAAASVDDITVEYAHQLASGSDLPDYMVLHQTRTYHWTGTQFVLTAGPTSLDADIDLTFTSGPLTFGAAVDGCRTGTLTVSITNNGTVAVTDLAIVAFIGRPADRVPSACAEDDSGYRALSLSIPPGATRTATVTYTTGDPLDLGEVTSVALTTTGNTQTAAPPVVVPVTVG